MAKDKNIKKLNRKYLVGFLVVNICVFIFLSNILTIEVNDFESFMKKLLDPKNVFVFILYVVSIILEGVLSSDLKAKLVFWKWHNPLPGCRAFSHIAKNDPRINIKELKIIFPKGFPKSSKEQNSAWYNLYRKYSSVTTVFESHRSFLLTRDLSALSLILIPVSFAGYYLLSVWIVPSLFHAFFLISVFIINNLASKNYGNRFTANVLVEAIHDNNNGE